MLHTFHIPVMGIAFSIDTPLKVAHYGIHSVISIMEDSLLEQVRKVYAEKAGIPFQAITTKMEDYKANRVMAYLNQIKILAEKKFNDFKEKCSIEEAWAYINLLPGDATIKQALDKIDNQGKKEIELISWLRENAEMGSIDVNIMTKVDRVNYKNSKALDKEFNDAHASLRGYAKSDLKSALVLSAGFNPSLYSYLATFEDFFPNANDEINKKIILKVSDYRSALIQSKFLAKKGLLVSEFRIESGLNCGGHAFATEGYLLGPILEEFKNKRMELIQSMETNYAEALLGMGRSLPNKFPSLKITAQGGVGTAEEHSFLLNHYELSAVGWGSPFLLVPEVSCLDNETRELLRKAEEKDLYLSNISPLGVPFNNLRNNSKDLEKQESIKKDKPGSPCVKKYLSFNTEFSEKPICTASRSYQSKKIKEVKKMQLSELEYRQAVDKITEKACICTGLGTSFLLNEGLSTHEVGSGVSICPGPNMAYFNKIVSLKEMVNHIYGRINIIDGTGRPHMFIKELKLYLNYYKKLVDEFMASNESKQTKTSKKLDQFRINLLDGIDYYKQLFSKKIKMDQEEQQKIEAELKQAEMELEERLSEILMA